MNLDEATVSEMRMPDPKGVWDIKISRDVELAVLDEVENMEDRICHASLQVKVRALCASGVNLHQKRYPGQWRT